MNKNFYDIIIIGGGCAGMTAAVYARRAGKRVLILEKETFGGQIAYSPRVENFPGIISISGAEFSDNLLAKATELGADAELEAVLEIRDNGRTKTVVSEYETYTCYAVIVATGLKHRMQGAENEESFIGKGASFCAVCDGAFYTGGNVAVIGGGNTALEDALFLSDLCDSVRLIHRRDTFRGEERLVETIKSRGNISVITDTIVTGFYGEDKLEYIKTENIKTGEKRDIELDGVFIAVGQIPESGIFKNLLETDDYGYIKAGENCISEVPGIFIAGDCRTKEIRQLTTAAADGSVAALAACKYVDETI